MKDYRTYMDRITVSPALHGRLLDALATGRPRRPARRRVRAYALAACCTLVLLGGWGAWRTAVPRPGPTAGVADPPAAVSPAPEPPEEHTLTVGPDPFDGQPHSFFNVPALELADCTGSGTAAADYAWPDGSFREALTAEEITAVLGGTDQVPWSLCWYGFGLDGTVLYDSQGQVLLVTITGVLEETSFTLELSPGQIPPSCIEYPDAAVQDYDGVEVTGWYVAGGEGEDLCGVKFLSGAVGVRFTCQSPGGDSARELTNLLVRYAAHAGGGFTTEPLEPEAVPGEASYQTLPGTLS